MRCPGLQEIESQLKLMQQQAASSEGRLASETVRVQDVVAAKEKEAAMVQTLNKQMAKKNIYIKELEARAFPRAGSSQG